MRSLLFLGMMAVVMILASAAFAYPDLNATTGIMAVPTACVVAQKHLVGAADVLFFDTTSLNARAIYGLSNRFEVGAAVASGEADLFGGSVKYLTPSTLFDFNWALGGSIVSSDDIGDGYQIFFTGTRSFGSIGSTEYPLIGTIGVNFTDLEDASAIRPFVAAELALSERTEVAGEFVLEAGDFGDSIFSALIRYNSSDRWILQTGFTNALGFTTSADESFFLGAAYDFGG